jgi:hypothetical protein
MILTGKIKRDIRSRTNGDELKVHIDRGVRLRVKVLLGAPLTILPGKCEVTEIDGRWVLLSCECQ